MNSSNEPRWQLRLENFGRALRQLNNACQKDDYTPLELAGLVQTFQFTFELAWKTLRDRLLHEGYLVNSPRTTIRQAFTAGYVSEEDCEALLDCMLKRSQLNRTYEEKIALEAVELIKFRYAGLLTTVWMALDNLSNRTEE